MDREKDDKVLNKHIGLLGIYGLTNTISTVLT